MLTFIDMFSTDVRIVILPPTAYAEMPPTAYAEMPPTAYAEMPPTAYAEMPPTAYAERWERTATSPSTYPAMSNWKPR